MYHFIAGKILHGVYRNLSLGNYEPALRHVAPNVKHIFPGNSAIGGTRHSAEGLRLWFERVYRLLPDLTFEAKNIVVSGWPWDTTAAVEWETRATLSNGQSYHNFGVHIYRMRWGRVILIEVHQDNQSISALCTRLAQLGQAEAAASPVIA